MIFCILGVYIPYKNVDDDGLKVLNYEKTGAGVFHANGVSKGFPAEQGIFVVLSSNSRETSQVRIYLFFDYSAKDLYYAVWWGGDNLYKPWTKL